MVAFCLIPRSLPFPLQDSSESSSSHTHCQIVCLPRATTSCFLWELLVDDVLRLKALRPTLLEDVSHYFLKVANQRLRELDDVTLYEVLLSRGFAFD